MTSNVPGKTVEIIEDSSNKQTKKKTAVKTIWKDIMIEELIDMYQAQDCLWNMSIPDYRPT